MIPGSLALRDTGGERRPPFDEHLGQLRPQALVLRGVSSVKLPIMQPRDQSASSSFCVMMSR